MALEEMPELDKIYVGDCSKIMARWPPKCVQTVVTSPPYWGLRDYGVKGQLGLEPTPEHYVQEMVYVFRKVRRVLRDDGTLWMNLGDSYNSPPPGARDADRWPKQSRNNHQIPKKLSDTLKPKDQMFMPHRVAIALQADGWYARQTIVWNKPNAMPESIKDRPSTTHEYIFLMSKSQSYFYDNDAIREPYKKESIERRKYADKNTGDRIQKHQPHRESRECESNIYGSNPLGRNKRSVWTIPSTPFHGAHFATFPPELIKPCILAGSPPGGVVLDPFMGAGTTALVAATYDRRFLGIELNPEYAAMAERRVAHERDQLKFI